jgi:O-antigen/teichoic acid export membrane protein
MNPERPLISGDTPTAVTRAVSSERQRLTALPVLARGSLSSAVGQVIPLLVGLLVVPFVVHRLGPDAFGVLSLGWTLLTLSVVFNLGLGRATTKYAAGYLASGDGDRLPSLFWTSVVLNVVIGVAGGALTCAVAIWLLASGLLRVPPGLVTDATWMFVWLSMALPFTFVTSTLRGMLEAGQHFDEVNVARVVLNSSIFVLPAVAVVFDARLAGIGVLLLGARVAETIVFWWLCSRRYPSLAWTRDAGSVRTLLAFGGWLTVTNALIPLIMNVDRFMIGSLCSVGAVGFYAVAADLVMRLTVVPSSLVLPLFPAFSALAGAEHRLRLQSLHARAMKYTALGMAPLVAVAVVGSRAFLGTWLGAAFATQSAVVMQVLAVGVLVNSVAFLPYTLLQAVGRPDLPAKCHLAEAPVAFFATWFLTASFGIVGAAVATGLRVMVDLGLLIYATVRLGYLDWRTLRASRGWEAMALVAALLATAIATLGVAGMAHQAAILVAAGLTWAGGVWLFAFDAIERTRLARFFAHPSTLLATPHADDDDR